MMPIAVERSFTGNHSATARVAAGKPPPSPTPSRSRLAANMADLRVVQVDNVLYVTTAENAKALQQEQEKRTLGPSGSEKGDPKPPRK